MCHSLSLPALLPLRIPHKRLQRLPVLRRQQPFPVAARRALQRVQPVDAGGRVERQDAQPGLPGARLAQSLGGVDTRLAQLLVEAGYAAVAS